MLKLFDETGQWSTCTFYDNKRPIDIAAEYGHIEIVGKYLPKDENPKGINALIRAAIRHRTDKVLSYVQDTHHDGDIHSYHQALHYACRHFHGHQSIKRITFEPEISKYNENGYTPLMLAIKHRQVNAVIELLNNKHCPKKVIKMTTNDGTKRIVLHICAEVHEDKITDVLLKQYFTWYEGDTELLVTSDVMKNTPLHTCAQKGNLYMCKKLIEYYKLKQSSNEPPYPPEKKEQTMWTMTNHKKWTALHEAIYNGYADIVVTMQTNMNPADFESMSEIVDEELRTTLHLAAAQGQLILEFLLKKPTRKEILYERNRISIWCHTLYYLKHTVLSVKEANFFIHRRVLNTSFIKVFFALSEMTQLSGKSE